MSETKTVEQFNILIEWASVNSYNHYEISNYCTDDNYSKHNTNYWQQKKYLGLGPSAHSYNQKSRQWNVSNVKKYVDGAMAGKIPFDKEVLTPNQQFNEYIMVSLRTMWGIDLNYVENIYGSAIRKKIEKDIRLYINKGKVIKSNARILLTRNGKVLADGIASDLFI